MNTVITLPHKKNQLSLRWSFSRFWIFFWGHHGICQRRIL